MTTQQVRNAILLILAAVSFGLVVWAEITGHPIDPTINTLLGVILGFIGSQSSAQQGAETAQTPTAPASVAVRVVHVPSGEPTPDTSGQSQS